jgi:hypothetical protein
MSEPYYLKCPTNEEALECLNRLSINHIGLKVDYHAISGVDEVDDWANAIKSGKKIINPLSPREEFETMWEIAKNNAKPDIVDGSDEKCLAYADGIYDAAKIIAKEHPDVADWLKDGEPDA